MKRITVLLLTALLLTAVACPLMTAAPAMAAEKFTLERITDIDQLGTSFYSSANEVLNEIEQEIAEDLGDQFKTKEIWCVCDYSKGRAGGDYWVWIYEEIEDPVWAWTDIWRSLEIITGQLESEGIFLYACRPVLVPQTGDNTPIALTAGLLLLSGAALIALKKRAVR